MGTVAIAGGKNKGMTKKILVLHTFIVLVLQLLMIATWRNEIAETQIVTMYWENMVGMACANTALYYILFDTWHFDYTGRNKFTFVIGIAMIGFGVSGDLPLAYIVVACITTIAVSVISLRNQKKK